MTTTLIQPDDTMLSDDDFALIRHVVHQHCGIALSGDKKPLVRARLSKPVRNSGHTTVRAYLKEILADRNGKAFTAFIDSISTNLTSFFREADHFDYLAKTVMPALVAKKRTEGEQRLLAWSAACSSGEEPYTLAMTLLDSIRKVAPEAPPRCEVRILASDISTRVLQKARAGVYRGEQLSKVPLDCRERYFRPVPSAEPRDDRYEVSPELRNVIRFRHLNLIESWPFTGPFDFIFCRNVMIYFDVATQTQLIQRFWNCLRPGGLLFTGHSESLTAIAHRFVHVRPSIYEKRV